MLYNPQLETFLHVADAGSFNRAAAESFITPTAVKKQITRLENDVGAVLFYRTHLGLSLTPAGKSLYISAKRLIQFSKDAASQARREAEPTENIIRIGISPMTPADRIFTFWPKISKACPDCKIQLVPYENSLESAQRTLGNLGTNIDVIAGVFDEELLAARHCEGLPLFEEPICAAVSQSHSLASRNRLRVEDLYGQKLLLIQHGWCRSVDHMREELRKKHPQIEIVDFNFFNVDIFNRCQNSGDILMAVENWANVHPLLKMLPVDWPYTLQFGIFHAPKPSNYVQRFLDALKGAEKA